MGFEATPIPPPPGATFKGKIPEIRLTGGSVMDIDNEYGVEDFAAEIAVISDHGSDLVDKREFCGFCRSAHTAMNIEEGEVEGEESEEENSPLYRMEALPSEADALMSSPSRQLTTFYQVRVRMIIRTLRLPERSQLKERGRSWGRGGR